MPLEYPDVMPEETEILEKFKERVQDIDMDEIEALDINMIKWLRARNHDLDRAEQMVRKSWEWRNFHDYNNILDWKPPRNYELYFPYEISGYDMAGSPVIVVPACEWDSYVKREISEGRKDVVIRFVVQATAKIIKDAKEKTCIKDGRLVTQCVLIFDLTGFSMRHLTSIAVPEVMLESFRNFERNFPDSLRVAYVINAPSLFALLFPVVKKILAARTIRKIQLFDGNASKWKKTLLSEITPENLPTKYGGILPDMLHKKIQAAKLVGNNDDSAINEFAFDALNVVTIGAGSKLSLDYQIRDPQVKLSWIFKSDTYDIGFSVTQGKDEVISNRRLNGNVIHEDSCECLKLGTYTITFDNTYSLFRAKTLHYLITVEDSKNAMSLEIEDY